MFLEYIQLLIEVFLYIFTMETKDKSAFLNILELPCLASISDTSLRTELTCSSSGIDMSLNSYKSDKLFKFSSLRSFIYC